MAFIRDSYRRDFRGQGTPFVGAIVPIPATESQRLVMSGITLGGMYTAIKETIKGAMGLGVDAGEITKSINALAGGLSFGMEQQNLADLLKGPIGPVFFQYFPEVISDSRENGVTMVGVPVVSNPVPSLVVPSERNISFTVVFSQERWAGVDLFSRPLKSWDKYNFDVSASINAIRAFTYPVGAFGGKVGVTPVPLMLTLPGTKIGIDSDSIVCILRGYDTEYVAFHPDGQPRLARMVLSFTEILLDLERNITLRNFVEAHARMRACVEDVFDRGVPTGLLGGFGRTKNVDVSKVPYKKAGFSGGGGATGEW